MTSKASRSTVVDGDDGVVMERPLLDDDELEDDSIPFSPAAIVPPPTFPPHSTVNQSVSTLQFTVINPNYVNVVS